MSISAACVKFKEYVEEFGPGRRHPDRPRCCPYCECERVWYNGWRVVHVTVLLEGAPHRRGEGVAVQRVRCARPECRRSWTLYPSWIYPHRSYQLDVVEAALDAYLGQAAQSYRSVAARLECNWVTLWLWVGWLAGLVTPGFLLAQVRRLGGAWVAAKLLPAGAPASGRARSGKRAGTVEKAAQVLAAVCLLHRAQPEPPDDGSPLRWYLATRFLEFRRKARLTRPGFSPVH